MAMAGFPLSAPGASELASLSSAFDGQNPHTLLASATTNLPTTTPSTFTSRSSSSLTKSFASSTTTIVQTITTQKSNSMEDDDDSAWNNLSSGTKAGVIVAVFVGLALFAVSLWFCNCCGMRRRHANQKRNEALYRQSSSNNSDIVPLQDHPQPQRAVTRMGRMLSTRTTSNVPPPMYAETAPPRHTTIAGGITHVREEEEGVISDGKTPLSEIPFEDVRLDHGEGSSSSESSSARNFQGSHMGMGGNTVGHTNS